MCLGRVIVEGLDENELVRVLHAAGPLEPFVARLGAGGGGERPHRLDELIGQSGLHGKLHDDQDHVVNSMSPALRDGAGACDRVCLSGAGGFDSAGCFFVAARLNRLQGWF